MTAEKKRPRGRPATGKNTVVLSYCVHKDFAEHINNRVKSIISELKERQAMKLGAKSAETGAPESKTPAATNRPIKKEVAVKGGKQGKKYQPFDTKNRGVQVPTVKDLNKPTHQVKNLSEGPAKSNFSINTDYLRTRQNLKNKIK